MSLVTRCPSCSTTFRVVQDQLRVSEGWVRCGRCMQTFDATLSLFDLSDKASAARASASTQRVLDDLSRVGRDAYDDDVTTEFAPPPDMAETPRGEPERREPRFEPEGAPAVQSVEGIDADHAPRLEQPTTAALSEAESEAEEELIHDTVLASRFPLDAIAPPARPPVPQPEFVRRADREALWRRPAVRATLVLAVVLLASLLSLQFAVAERDLLAARYPQLRPQLQIVCDRLDLKIEPLRRIEQLSVDSSGLARVDGAALYRLALTLHNHSDMALMTPAIDLVLTDSTGQAIARRVVPASEFGYLDSVVAARHEVPLQAVLSAVDRRITGYTVELFYP